MWAGWARSSRVMETEQEKIPERWLERLGVNKKPQVTFQHVAPS